MNISALHNLYLSCSSICIDTRKITQHSLFFAIKGQNFDANTFSKEALDKGALYVIIDNKDFFIDERTIVVEDSLSTLQQLATFHRRYLNLPIIALTGSNGKTTTKELIQLVLSKKFKTTATVGNLNNHIGVPLTLLTFTKETEIGIVEMGANHQLEIEFLCELAQPDFGYITNFGKAHLEGFGGIDGVIKGKSEMYNYIRAASKIAFINLNDPIQVEKSKNCNFYSFGLNNPDANVSITGLSASPFVTIHLSEIAIQTHLVGLYNANNVNAAIAIGNYFGVSNTDIQQALQSYIPDNNRSQLIAKGTNQIILDAYNANPSSMAVAIENFLQLNHVHKVAVLGDMFELGDESFKEHYTVVQLFSDVTDVTVYFIGHHFYKHQIRSSHLYFYESFDDFSTFLIDRKIENSTILIKGSRGMALERTLSCI